MDLLKQLDSEGMDAGADFHDGEVSGWFSWTVEKTMSPEGLVLGTFLTISYTERRLDEERDIYVDQPTVTERYKLEKL